MADRYAGIDWASTKHDLVVAAHDPPDRCSSRSDATLIASAPQLLSG